MKSSYKRIVELDANFAVMSVGQRKKSVELVDFRGSGVVFI